MSQTLVVGDKFGRWTVVSEPYRPPDKDRYFVDIVCECNYRTRKALSKLTSGQSKMCPPCYKEEGRSKRNPESILINLVHGWYKKSAKQRGIHWGLTKQEFASLIFQDCAICGTKPKNKASDRLRMLTLPKYNGVDRIVNDLGYVIGNVQTCCRWCNEAKKAKTVAEFDAWIEGIMKTYGANRSGDGSPSRTV